MATFNAAYQGEWIKLISRRKYIVFFVLGLTICVGWALLGHAAAQWLGHYSGLWVNLVPTPIGALPFFLRVLMPLIIFMATTDLITTEANQGSIKASLYRPITRWKLYGAKLLAILTYVMVYLMAVFMALSFVSFLFASRFTFGDVTLAWAAYLLSVPPLAVLIAFAGLVALFSRSSTLVMFLLMAIYGMLYIIPLIFPVLFQALFTSYLGWHRFWIGIIPSPWRLVHMTVVLASYGVAFFMAGSLLFDRQEY